MELKEVNKDVYDYDAYLDEQYGREGTPEREAFRTEARNYMLGNGGRRIEIVDAMPI